MGQFLDPLGFVPVTPQLLVKQDSVEPLETRLERHFPVRFPEEFRVTQPRRHDPLCVLRDDAFVLRLRVHDRKKRFLQLSIVGHDREPVLVMYQRGRQYFVREVQKAAVEEPGDDSGILDQVGDFVDQCGVLFQLDPRAKPPRVVLEVTADAVLSLPNAPGRRSAPTAAPGTRQNSEP